MVLDSSAIIAVLRQEPDSDTFLDAIEVAPVRRVSTATLVEAAIVMQARFGDAGERELDIILHRLRVDVVAVTEEHAEIARTAFRRYGKGRHAAALNYGDCFPYALAMSLGEPLLFAGSGFSKTDVASAV